MGYAYYGHYDRVPEHAKLVAKAFYAGRSCKRTNCETDGETYWLEGQAIAQRIDAPKRIARKLAGELSLYDRWSFPTVAISWCGWDTWMTARHLRALGFDATPSHKGSNTPRLIDGRYDPEGDRRLGLIAAEEIATWPRWEVMQRFHRACQEEVASTHRSIRERRTFQNLSLSLF